jgi:trigger factor
LNLQTELLENRVAQLTIEVEADRLEKAKRKAARDLSKRVNIPGFRKGKAPYNLLARYLGEGAILEEAIDQLGPDIYREGLEESELEPYGPGQLEKIDTNDDNDLVLVFNVPLAPTVDLGDYRTVRIDYEAPEIDDDRVEEILDMMRQNKAESEVKEGPAAEGDSVKIDLFGTLVDDEDDDAEVEDDDADSDEEHDHDHDDNTLFDQKNWEFVIGQEMREPLPGFSEAVTGISAGEERSFDLAFPEDDEDYDEMLLGKTVAFTVTCHEVSARTVPELTDEFVQELEEEGIETVDQLREKVASDLESTLVNQAESEYAEKVLDAMVEGAAIEFPEMMIDETIDEMVASFEQQLQQQGMDLNTFLTMRQWEEADLRNEYREPAASRIKRSLVLGEIVNVEALELDPRAIDRAVKDRAAQYANGNEEIQKIFEDYLGNPQGRSSLGVELLTQQAYDRMIAIAKGEEPEVGPIPYEEEDEPEVEDDAANEAESADEAAAPEAEAEAPAEAVEEEAPDSDEDEEVESDD